MRQLGSESGFEVLEFAMVLPVFAAVAIVFISFVQALYYYINLTNVANDGARIAAVSSPTLPNGSHQLGSYLCGQVGALRGGSSIVDTGNVTVTYGTANKAVGDPVTVQVSTHYHLLPFQHVIPSLSIGIAGTSTMRVENPPAATGANYDASTNCS